MAGPITKHNNLMTCLLDHYIQPPPQAPLPDMPAILDYADFDLISVDGSHLLAEAPTK